MKKIFILLLICLSIKTIAQNSTCDESDQCTYSFYLRDAFGDGWNGANLQVIQNGVVIETLILSELDEETILVPLCKNIPFEIYWSAGGSFPNEVILKVFDNNGIQIYNLDYQSSSLVNTTLFTSSSNCKKAFQFVPFKDINGNSVKDVNEPYFSEGVLNYQINNSGEIISANASNVFYIYLENENDTYDFYFTIFPEFADYYSSTISFDDLTYSPTENNLYYIPVVNTTPYNDVRIILNSQFPVPGTTFNNYISYRNDGSITTSGTLSFEKDPILTITDVSISGIVNSPNGFTVDYSNLMPYQWVSFTVTMSVPPIPTVSIGDLVTNSVSISSVIADINLDNNSKSRSIPIVAAYDPNNKLESHGGQIEYSTFSENDYLFYTINFENIGNASAFVVRIEDLLDEKLDESSLRMIHSSHNYQLERINNQLIWSFPNINLPTSVEDTDIGKGFVHFKIKPKPGYAIGDVIENTAEIYFDFNPPIITNTVETEFVENLSTPDFINSTVVLSPNPTKDKLQIQLNGSETIAQISVYDVVGKRVYFRNKIEVNSASVDFSNLIQGVYMVEVITASNQKLVNKVIKQ